MNVICGALAVFPCDEVIMNVLGLEIGAGIMYDFFGV